MCLPGTPQSLLVPGNQSLGPLKCQHMHKKDVFRAARIHQFLMALVHILNSTEYQLQWRLSDGFQRGTGTLKNIPTYQP